MLSFKKILPFIIIFFSVKTGAQVCTGSLGDPVATISFGEGSNPGPPLSNVPAIYQYTASDCPSEGSYAIRNSTFFCFNSSWHVVAVDHSPRDPLGYFLLVNAQSGPSDVYVNTINGLCPGTSFEVEAWIVNLLKQSSCGGNGIDPNLTFTITDISGTILAQHNTGNIAESNPVTWTSHKFLFTAPANGSVILKITSMAPAGCGNEFGIDDISFSPCGATITSSFANTAQQQIQVCENQQQNLLLIANTGGSYQNPVFQWQESNTRGLSWTDIPGANGNTYLRTPATSGEYWYRCTVAEASQANIASCRFASNNLIVLVVASPFSQATNYVFGCYGTTTYLFASGGITYEWTGPNNFFSNQQGPEIPSVNFGHSGLYIVKVTNGAGCFDYDSTNLVIYTAPVATLTPTGISICEGDSVQLVAGGSISYRWSPTDGLSNDTIPAPFAKPKSDMEYTVRVYNEYTCFDTASVKVTVWKKPKAFAGPDKFLRKGKTVQLESSVAGSNISYNWSPPDYLDNPLFVRPKAGPPATMIYTLTVNSNNGCGTSTDDVKVEVINKLFIPTAFTPNNDGLNDKWEIVTFEDYPSATVEVYNRYGQIVYRGFGNNYQAWNGTFKGKPSLPGVYVYLLQLNNNTAVLKGTLTLIR